MKKRKYAEGGDMNRYSSNDEQFFSSEELTKQAKKPTYAASTKLDERDKREMAIQERVREKAKAEPKTFGEAFKAARAEGKKVFEYPKGSGKKFTTETKEEAAKKKAPAKKEASTKKTDRNQTDTGLLPSQAKKQAMDVDSKKTGSQRLAEKANRAGNIYARSKDNDKDKKRASVATISVDDIIGANKGGMMKKYNAGGYANCGASVKPNGGSRNK